MGSHLTSHWLPFPRAPLSCRGLATSPRALFVGKPFFKETEHGQPGWKGSSGQPGLRDLLRAAPCKTPSLMKVGPPPPTTTTTTTHSLPHKSASYKT